jgi:hypothetical protein
MLKVESFGEEKDLSQRRRGRGAECAEKRERRKERSGRRPKAAPTPDGENAGAANPFIDPDGYKKFVADKEQEFRAELAKQTLAAK